MRRVWIALVALAGGCRGILGIESPIDLPADAGEPPAPPDTAPPSCRAWHPRALDPCTLGVPLPAIELTAGAYTYDTTTAGGKLFDDHGRTVVESPLAIEQAGGAAVAVLSIDALAIDAGATLRVIGTKPLVIAAWSTIAIDGVVDASSHLGVTDEAAHIAQNIQVGAGANAACTGATGQHGADARGVGSGGGGGGALQGLGGDAPASGAPEVAGGAGGAAIALPAILVGGCGGGSSGAAGTTATLPATKSSVAQGGAGGGAIRLVAQTQLRVAGAIHANGAGGAGGPTASSCDRRRRRWRRRRQLARPRPRRQRRRDRRRRRAGRHDRRRPLRRPGRRRLVASDARRRGRAPRRLHRGRRRWRWRRWLRHHRRRRAGRESDRHDLAARVDPTAALIASGWTATKPALARSSEHVDRLESSAPSCEIAVGCNAGTGWPATDARGFHDGLGIAPFARVGATAIFGIGSASVNAWEDDAYAGGARISTNSWGSSR